MEELIKIQNIIEELKKENNLLKEELKTYKYMFNNEGKTKEKINKYCVKYRTLYMKYKHQQNNFEQINLRYKETIRLLQAEIIKNTDNEYLFEKIEKLNSLGV